MAFDLEMANSFVGEAPIICMVGLGVYDAKQQSLCCTIASINSRQQEAKLVNWFLQQLREFQLQQPNASLLSFSGTDNDIPWLKQRIKQYGVPLEAAAALQGIAHLDLKCEFQKRTRRDQISLKRLEELFGIERQDKLTSRKVSFLLTDVLRKDGKVPIPEVVHRYLFQDVGSLLHIFGRWEEVSLDDEHLGEREYLERLLSLFRRARRASQGKRAPLEGASAATVWDFALQLQASIEKTLSKGEFSNFRLPPLPRLNSTHPEVEQLRKRYQALKEIRLRNEDSYLLRHDLTCPRGALAVVRDANKQVLMIKRGEGLSRAPGCWGLPGGLIEDGELPGACARRELQEEAGISGRAASMLGVTRSYSGEYDLFWMEVVLDDYQAALQPDGKEASEVRWVSLDSLEHLQPLIPGALADLQRMLGGKRSSNNRHAKSSKKKSPQPVPHA